MNIKKIKHLSKLVCIVLAASFVFSMDASTYAAEDKDLAVAARADGCILQETMDYLVNEIGPRHTGTIAEYRAAQYVKSQFDKINGSDNVYDVSLDEFMLNWVPAKGLQINPNNKDQYGYLFANDRQQYGVIEADIPSGAVMGTAIPNNTSFRNFEGGLFHDFGVYDETGKTVASTPSESAVIAAGGKVYGTLRFDSAISAAMINDAITAIKSAYSSEVDVMGLFIARNDSVRTTNNQYGFTYNDIPAAVSGNYNSESTSLVGLSLADLEKAVKVGKTITKVYRQDPEKGWCTYARKPAKDPDNPDLVMVFTGHLDTVRSAPGAQDNTTSVTAALELARRYKDVDTGNIELIFVAMGGEEYNDFSGVTHIIDKLRAEGKDKVAINFNMDCITAGGNSVNVLGEPQDTYAVGTLQFQEQYQFPNWRNANYGDNLGTETSVFNLPAHLLTSYAKDVDWGSQIKNVRIFNWGASDHAMFAYFGIDATRTTAAARGGNFAINSRNTEIYGWQYHSSQDNMDDYSYERHLNATNFMGNSIKKAIELNVTKRAKFAINKEAGTVTLENADQLFKTYNKIEGSFTASNEKVPFAFTPGKTVIKLADAQNYKATQVVGSGAGISNHEKPQDNAIFTTKLQADTQIKAVTPPTAGSENSSITGDEDGQQLAEEQDDANPSTGDSWGSMLIVMGILLVSGAICAVVIRRKKLN